MEDASRRERFCATLAACAVVLCLNVCVYAGDQTARDTPAAGRVHPGESERLDARAQSGAEAADEARIYTAELRRCEGFSGAQRETCVDAAKRRLGQL